MFHLMPWKKRDNGGGVSVRHGQPFRPDSDLQPLARLRDDLNAVWNQFFEDPWLGVRGFGLPASWHGPAAMSNLGWTDDENEYVFRADLPGFEPEDFDVKVSGNTLTVRAEHKEQGEDKERGSSYRYGSYSQTVTLPHGADDEKIDARYHSGVLEIHLAKSEQARGKRIPVNTN
jgi:HSP20 family molecular chaperone IbpA